LQARADFLSGAEKLPVFPEIVVQVTLRTLGRVQRQDELGQRGIEVVGDRDGRGAFPDLPEVGLEQFPVAIVVAVARRLGQVRFQGVDAPDYPLELFAKTCLDGFELPGPGPRLVAFLKPTFQLGT